jgi:hypothetical protein
MEYPTSNDMIWVVSKWGIYLPNGNEMFEGQ